MPNRNLKTLSIEYLRGVKQPLDITFEQKMCLIYGENGTGKTSICDALDFLGNERVGSVIDVGLGTGVHQYWPFLGCSPDSISVSLHANNGDSWTANAIGRTVNVTPSSGRPKVKIWRRSQLFKLLLDKPADKYQVIKPFIDVSKIEHSERELKKTKDEISRNLNDASIKLVENKESIGNQMRLMGSDEDDEISWARSQVVKSDSDLTEEQSHLRSIEEKLGSLITQLETHKSLDSDITSIHRELDDAILAQEEASSNISETAENTLSILQASHDFFSHHGEAEACPLCNSKENAKGLPQRVESEIKRYSELSKARSFAETKSSELGRLETRHADQVSAAKRSVEQISELCAQSDELEELRTLIGSIDFNVQLLETLIVDLRNMRSNLLEKYDSLTSTITHLSTLKIALEQYDTNLEQQRENNQLLPIIESIYELHQAERKKYIDEILGSISTEVGRLYEEIHPGEGLNNIALKLNATGSASLGIESEFLGEPVQPSAYFSNSHIDSLGLCILISLAKLEEPDNTVLVMDDILGSIDEPHFERMVQLIYQESAHFLLTVVTTHYQAWHHKIRRGQLRNADCSLVELRKWNSNLGVSIQANARPLVEILRANLRERPGEIEPIAANAGHLLEQIGDLLTLRYECAVPRRMGGNSVGDYLSSLKPDLTRELKVERLKDDGTYEDKELHQLIENLKQIFQVRNIFGAHYNELASLLHPGDVIDFGEKVLELCDWLICPVNGLPMKEKGTGNHKYWSTPNQQTIRLYPFQR